jgi:Tfp pilus assembly protein FimT
MDFRHSQIAIRKSQIRAFTLTEMLVAIGLIVLLISIAVPTFSALRGNNSIENATNVVSASLARARAQAVGLQRPFGIAFYREAASGRYGMALVEIKSAATWTTGTNYSAGDWVKTGTALPYAYYVAATDHTSAAAIGTDVTNENMRAVHTTTNGLINGGTPPIDLVPGSNRLLLPTGIACAVAGTAYADSGLILFDENGTLTTRNVTIAQESMLFQQIVPGASAAGTVATSQIALMLFNDEDAKAAPDIDDYINESGTPLLVNRYNGTIVKGE